MNTKKFSKRLSHRLRIWPRLELQGEGFLRKSAGVRSGCEIKIRAAHEIMAARTTQLALLIDQLMPALQAKPPMLAGNVFIRWRGARVDFIKIRFGFWRVHCTRP